VLNLCRIDFTEAFDSVTHERFLMKLRYYGISGRILGWIGDFLRGRHQRVTLEGFKSTAASVESGVPQGSVLGPLLFLLYINDLPQTVASSTRLFADDCLMYRVVKKPKDKDKIVETNQDNLQKDLDALSEWQNRWQLRFNPKKCYVMRITRSKTPACRSYFLNGVELQVVETSAYLGVQLQNNLGWNAQVEYAAGKASRTLGMVKRNLRVDSVKLKTTAYNSLVRPVMEYGAAAWDPHTQKNINKLEGIQRSAARFILRNYERTPGTVTGLLRQLEMETLEERRREMRLCMLFKILNDLVDVPHSDLLTIAQQRTRGSHSLKFDTLRANTDTLKYSFYSRTIVDWNGLYEEVVTAQTLPSFKERLRRY